VSRERYRLRAAVFPLSHVCKNLLDCLSALDFLNWADRNKAVEEGKKERQEQRAENIANYRGKRKGAKGKADAQHKTD